MDDLSRITIAIAFIGLLGLVFGFTTRDRPYGAYVMWAGVMCMIGVVAFHIVRTVQS